MLFGLGLYVLVLTPGLAPQAFDVPVAMLAALISAMAALGGFDTIRLDRWLAGGMVAMSVIILAISILLVLQGNSFRSLLLSLAAIALGSFGLRKILGESRGK